MTRRHVLVVGNGRELPTHVHQVDPDAVTTMLVRTAVVKKVRQPTSHARVLAVSSTDPADWVALALAVHRLEPITHVATFSEKDQDKAAAVAEALGLPMHSTPTVRAVHDKVEMRRRVAAAGLPGPESTVVGSEDEVRAFAARVGYPVVLKPLAGAASSGVTVVTGEDRVPDAWRWGRDAAEPDVDTLIVEQFLDGPEVSVEAFTVDGRHHVAAVTEKFKDGEHCVELGHVVGAGLEAAETDALRAATRDVLDALGVTRGITHTELIRTAGGPRLVETHLRPAGDDIPEMIRDTYGLDLLDLLVRQALGQDVQEQLDAGLAALAASDDVPAIWYLTAPATGTVAAVEGLDEARAVPGVHSVALEVEPGDEVHRPARDSRDRVVAVRAVARSGAEAIAVARRAAALVRIEITAPPSSPAPSAVPSRPVTAPGGSAMSEPTDRYELSGLHHVQLAIPPGGEDLARRFYGEILGMTELEKPPVLAARGGCWFRRGGLEVHLGVEKDFRPAAKAHPGILVADLDGLAARLQEQGADVEWDDNFPGHRRFYSHDLHGNRLELLEPEGA